MIIYNVFIMEGDLSSTGRGPYEEALLSDVEIHVAADLVRHVRSEITPNNAVPHRFVLLFK